MTKQLIKLCMSALVVGALLVNSGCNQSPIRNPFAGRQEPKLGELPPLGTKDRDIAMVSWSSNALSKQERFSKLIPFVTNDMVYAADHSGKVVALNRGNGKKVFSNNTGYKFIAGPSVAENLILLATKDAKIIALDKATGHLAWEAKISSEVLASPTGKQGIVLVHANDGSVSALNAKNGQTIWHVDQTTPTLTLRYSSAPVIANDKVLVGLSSGKLIALNLHSGLIEWERTISIPKGRSELQRMVDISADPVMTGDSIYVITYQGKLAGVNVGNGDLLWERDVSSYQNMALLNDTLFVTDNEHNLWAIDRHNGSTLWKQNKLAHRYITGPATLGNMVVVGDRGGYLHFLSAEKGLLMGRMSVSGKIYQSPLTMGKEVLVSSHNGKMAAVHTYSGAV
jgi:outer membrane protein assembly factor BamB